ncbi:MAG: hypothetical protein ACM3SQ_15380 [Betaproteobacteria bacterium]
MAKHFDVTSIVVVAATLILFVAALFVKGFTHDILLEGAVFLVSVKLILMAYKNSVMSHEIEERLEEIRRLLESRRDR